MNLNKKGWLSDYVELKERQLARRPENDLHKGLHPDQSLYSIIQPTGIMYGYPVKELNESTFESHEANVKLLLLDTLVSCYFLSSEILDKEDKSHSEKINEAVYEIVNFYNSVYDELYTGNKNFFGKRRSDMEVAEKILDKRIKQINGANFWARFFHNSLLFIDIYFFRQWAQTSHDKMIANYLKQQKDELRVNVVKVMAAAAHANLTIEPEERKLFEYFISSLPMPAERKKEARDYFDNGVMVDEIPLPDEESWILKKYFLELAILTIWADKKVEQLELDFLNQFGSRLGFDDDEFDASMMAVEGFVLDYWIELDKLQSKQDFDVISQQYISRLSKIINRYKETLYREVYERKNLLKLIKKARVNEITDKEKEYIRLELVEALSGLPAFRVIALPKNFLSLQVLMGVMPQDFFKNIN